MKQIWYDLETTGLRPGLHSILTAYFGVTDENLNLIDDLYLQLKPEDPSSINYTKEALEVTGINLDEHLKDPNTVTYKEGGEILYNFIKKYEVKGKKKGLQPAGHNILDFDNNFLFSQLISRDKWEEVVHYNSLDTIVIATFLRNIKVIPPDAVKLTALAEHFDIPVVDAHNAKGDILMNIEVYKKFCGILSAQKKEAISVNDKTLLEIIEENG